MAVSLDTLDATPPHAPVSVIAPVDQAPLPPESPLAMPIQSLRTWSRKDTRKPLIRRPKPWLVRLFVFAASIGLTLWGAVEMYRVVSVSGVTALQWVLVGLFTVNFPGSRSPSRAPWSASSPCCGAAASRPCPSIWAPRPSW